nr:MAG TPA: hypothetical protein [Caudoviricetes sp.]
MSLTRNSGGASQSKFNKKSFSQVTGSDTGSLAFSVPKRPYNYIIYIIPYQLILYSTV